MSFQFFSKHRLQLVSSFFYRCPAILAAILMLLFSSTRETYASGKPAVVIDERLAVLRDSPSLFAPLIKRLGRGRLVVLLNSRRSREGVVFYRVSVTRRTRGWLQSEAVVSPAIKRDDERLFRLVEASKDFDRISRAAIFLRTFKSSRFRPAVLLLIGIAADEVARKLSLEAGRRLDESEMKANRASLSSYFLNYAGLDRYKRMGIGFVFDKDTKAFHYDGASWEELIRRHPETVEASDARKRLESFDTKPDKRNF